MIDRSLVEAIEYQDTDALLAAIDRHARSKDWETLLELQARCREAGQRGRQLWGVDENIRYRIALGAPPELAGPTVTEGPTRFTLGPLAEVAASTRTWQQLSPHLEYGPTRATVAAERVVRGDVVPDEVADLPGAIQTWEPDYPTATYKPDKVETPSPTVPDLHPATITTGFDVIDDFDSEAALSDLVAPWTSESNGRSQTASVSGTAIDAVSALGLRSARIGPLEPPLGLSWMAWTGASGGAHGRRRGAAAGRYAAWWTVAMLADLAWPPSPDEVGEATQRLRWHWFDDGAPSTGWQFNLAVEDSESGLAWAITAVDQAGL